MIVDDRTAAAVGVGADLSATADPQLARTWSAAAQVDRMVAVEVAWVEAGAEVGEVDEEVVTAVRAAGGAGLDVGRIVDAVAADATPVIALLEQLRDGLAGPAASALHDGLTSQDVIDSATMLGVRSSLERLAELVGRTGDRCATLAREHRDTPMLARTLLQPARPTTFGLRAAHWLDGLRRDRDRLARAGRLTCLSWGGAVGTGAGQAPARVEAWGRRLGLAVPALPWHGDRDRVHELAGLLATVAGQAASRGRDLVLLAQAELGEVVPATGGASSAMPAKRNPAAAVLSLSAARVAAAAAGGLLAATEVELDRAAGAWQAEWALLPSLLSATGAALAHGLSALDVVVDADAMAARVDGDDVGRAGELVDAAVERWEAGVAQR